MVRGLLRLRDEVADLCTIQVTAFPQDGIFARDGDDERVENALRLGVDCVGGIPHYEPTSELGLREVHPRLRAGEADGRRIDGTATRPTTPRAGFLEVMADDTVKFGLGGRVTASHCTAMGSYEPYYLLRRRNGFLSERESTSSSTPFANSLSRARLGRLSEAPRFAQAEGAAGRRGQTCRSATP